jgi:hypothetical protein
MVGKMLNHILSGVDPEFVMKERIFEWEDYGTLKFYSQWEFIDAPVFEYLGFNDYGYVYFPYECYKNIDLDDQSEAQNQSKGGCKIHIALHGCSQSYQTNWDDFVRYGGYLEYAASNRLIVLFP